VSDDALPGITDAIIAALSKIDPVKRGERRLLRKI
jgi:hypothetical protein